MYIGALARETGTTPKAIRHYEALGLLGPVARAGRYRVYRPADCARVVLIRQAQTLGLKLSELQPLLAHRSEPDWAGMHALITHKRHTLQQDILRLQALDRQLAQVGAQIHDCLSMSALNIHQAHCAIGSPTAPASTVETA